LLIPALKISVEKLSSSYYRALFKLLEPPRIEPKPLQFTNIWIPGLDEVPMSISDYTAEDYTLSIIFKVVGDGTRGLRDRNGFFGVKGFLGNGIDTSGYERILFVAGGSGIAPLPFLSRKCVESGCIVDVVWGVRRGDMLFNIGRYAVGLGEVYYATEDCTIGYCGNASSLVREIVERSGFKWSLVIGVGPSQMLREVCYTFRGLQDSYVSLETMVKCGLGACGSCLLKPLPKLLCLDGPVFKCSEVYHILG
jgi:dihydroorotate dehydrogenase electron transfer subunit